MGPDQLVTGTSVFAFWIYQILVLPVYAWTKLLVLAGQSLLLLLLIPL